MWYLVQTLITNMKAVLKDRENVLAVAVIYWYYSLEMLYQNNFLVKENVFGKNKALHTYAPHLILRMLK